MGRRAAKTHAALGAADPCQHSSTQRSIPAGALCEFCLQAEMGGRAAKTRAALDALDPRQRIAMEGYRPGAYLRLRFSGVTARDET